MITRRHGREWALQMLFQAEANPTANLDHAIDMFWSQQWTCRLEEADAAGETIEESDKSPADRVAPKKIREFAEALVRGVLNHREALDEKIESYAKNWSMYRMGSVERNVLRLAFYELMYTDVPGPVLINEAVDLAKYFSTGDAGRFINGLVDKARQDLGK